MQSPPPHVIAGQEVTAAHHNALLDYVLRATPRAGRNTSVDVKPNGTFINAAPAAGGGGAALPLFPFTVRVIEDPDAETADDEPAPMVLAIYLPTYAVYLGTVPQAPSDTIAGIPDYGQAWQKIIDPGDGEPVTPPGAGESAVVYIALGRLKDEENHVTFDATRLIVEAPGDDEDDENEDDENEDDENEDDEDDDFAPTLKVPVAMITASESSSSGGTSSIVYTVTQYLYSALAWPKPEERPWTWDPALKGWRNAWYQNNRSVATLPESVQNEDLADGVYYLKIELATNAVDLVSRAQEDDAGDFTSNDDYSFFLVGAVVDGKADESTCPHTIPVEIHYE